MPDSFNHKIIYSDEYTVSCQHMTKVKSDPKLRLTHIQEGVRAIFLRGVFFPVSGQRAYISKYRGLIWLVLLS